MSRYVYCRPALIFAILGMVLFKIETNTAAQGTASLKHITHSFIKIKTADGVVIYIDPYGINEFADSADIVLISHEHFDHNEIARVRQKAACQVIRAVDAIQGDVYQTFTIGAITVRAVAAYNSYHPKNSSVGYVVEFNGIKLYHGGDTGKITEMADLAAQNITYALLPMDPTYTMLPEAATEAAAMIHADHDIPIHTADASLISRFTSPYKLVVSAGSSIELNAGSSSIRNDGTPSSGFMLHQNHPNPFNPTTMIDFILHKSSYISLKIYDVLGREISTLVSEYLPAGGYTHQWNAKNMKSGVYFYRLQAGSFSETKKLILLR